MVAQWLPTPRILHSYPMAALTRAEATTVKITSKWAPLYIASGNRPCEYWPLSYRESRLNTPPTFTAALTAK